MDRLRHVQMMFYSSARYWLGRRWTPAGRLVLGALGLSAVLGFDTAQSMAYQSFSLLLALVAIAVLFNRNFHPRVEARRALPRLATAGEGFSYSVRVRNDGAENLRGLTFLEDVDDPRPSLEEYCALKELSGDNW